MAANATTKLQISYGKDGSLVNVYADNAKELEELLTVIQDSATLIDSVGRSLGRSNTSANAVSYAKKVLGAKEVAPAGTAPDCKHGPMNFRSGVGDKGPWKGWMCSGPRELPKEEKCDAVWIK